MKIKTTLKKLKRGDVVSIDWIDSGDIEDSSSELPKIYHRTELKKGGACIDSKTAKTSYCHHV